MSWSGLSYALSEVDREILNGLFQVSLSKANVSFGQDRLWRETSVIYSYLLAKACAPVSGLLSSVTPQRPILVGLGKAPC